MLVCRQKEIHALKFLCQQSGASEEDIAACRPRRKYIKSKKGNEYLFGWFFFFPLVCFTGERSIPEVHIFYFTCKFTYFHMIYKHKKSKNI